MRTNIILLLLLSACSVSVRAQTEDITFRRVSPISGFSFQAIRTIKQDMFGYIWMGTHNDGIIKYNSKGTKRFLHDHENKNGLPSDRITSLVIDKQNNIWVMTDKGICVYNHHSQQFELIKYTYENGDAANKQLNSIELDGDGKLWIADENYIGYLDWEKKQLVRITHGLHHTPYHLYKDETNHLWLGTRDGSVYLVLPDEDKVIKKIDGPGSIARTIFSSQNELWVGYDKHGVRLYDLNGKLKTHFRYDAEPGYDIKSASIRKIWRDTRGRTWIGSYMGLFIYNGINLFRLNSDESTDLPHRSVFEIFEDKQGGIWVGTWAGGVSYAHPTDNKFNSYRHSNEQTSLSNNMVSSFAQAPNHKVYVGTEGRGLNEFNLHTEKFKNIEVAVGKKNLNIKTIFFDSNGGMWVGTGFDGLFYRPPGESNFKHFPQGEEDGKHISSPAVHVLCESDSGIFIGTNLDHIDFYNFKSHQINFEIKLFPPNQYDDRTIRSLVTDKNNNLWIASVKGVHQYHIPSKKMVPDGTNSICPHDYKGHEYYFITQLSDGNLWIGTRHHGIEIYNPETNETKLLDEGGLLEGKDVYGIIEGQNNNIWITSNSGLFQYNTKVKSSRRFIYNDGIQGNLFNPEAIFKDRDENLYFGGTNGFTLLQPNKIKMNVNPPNVFINSIEVNAREITPSQISINNFRKIILGPNENTIKFDFSADNYLLPEKNKFKYKLENYMDDWIEVDNSGSATLVNVPAGRYIFRVIACNNDGVWSEKQAILPITINQFWYRSKLAFGLYLLTFLAVVIVFIRFYFERLKLKKTVLIQKLERKNEDQLHEMKLKFFTNISHEFRTPLTLLSWPLKRLLNSKNLVSEQRDQLDTIKRNANRMLQLINQIMDLRRVEKGQLKLNLSKIELLEFINERILNFSEEAKSKNIQFNFNYEKEDCTIEADEEKLDKIIFNLLSNAFKFTPKNGNISIDLCRNQFQKNEYFTNQLSFGKLENEEYIEIQVTDDGEGIGSEDLPNIFDRFEQGKHKKGKENSSGIGLNLGKEYTLLHHGVIIVQSTPGEGTRFSVRLPKKQKAQKILFESHEKVKNIDSWEKPEISKPLSENYNEDITVLIVEDNEELIKYIILFLEKFYSVLIAKNGIQAIEILKTHNVHLIVSDVMMPEMDGFEFCQHVKSQMETSHIPVILLTALASKENLGWGLEKGADAYISKPFDEHILLYHIKNLLQQRKRLQDSYTQKFISKKAIDVGSLDNYFLTRINTVIENNLENESFSVDNLATEMGLSRSQLHRKLKQISNHSTSEYITMVKIKNATNLLASKKYNIDEVAFKSGFNSHSYFNKCFKKIHNKSPKEFLKQL